MREMKLSPSIFAADLGELKSQIKELEDSGVELLHVDVMDGHFVPNLSLGVPVVQSLRKATDLFLDTHLMITDPLNICYNL